MEKKNYIINLHAVGEKKITSGYAGPREVCGHFSTPAKVGTIAFEEAKMNAVDYYWNQNKRYWHGYRIGKLEVEVGRESGRTANVLPPMVVFTHDDERQQQDEQRTIQKRSAGPSVRGCVANGGRTNRAGICRRLDTSRSSWSMRS
jgi:hypothetical protein